MMLSSTRRRAHELRVRVRAERGHVSPGEPRVPARAVRVPVPGHGGEAAVSGSGEGSIIELETMVREDFTVPGEGPYY